MSIKLHRLLIEFDVEGLPIDVGMISAMHKGSFLLWMIRQFLCVALPYGMTTDFHGYDGG